MKLLIVTQKVNKNDDILGFFHEWILEFSKHVEKLTVICLEEGEHELPKNVEVLSLGKERGTKKVTQALLFYRYIFTKRNEYDTVFVHMNPIYIVLAGVIWKVLHKKIALWFTHKSVNTELKIATFFADRIFSASQYSFRLKTNKLHVVGHGIDVDRFVCEPLDDTQNVTLSTVGRITRIKSIDTLLKSFHLIDKNIQPSIAIIGGTSSEDDERYFDELQTYIQDNNMETKVSFVGSVPNNKINTHYCDASYTVNMCPTGGIDKAVIESLASGRICFVSNEGFREHLGEYADLLMFEHEDYEELAEKISTFHQLENKKEIAQKLSHHIKDTFATKTLVSKIVKDLK